MNKKLIFLMIFTAALLCAVMSLPAWAAGGTMQGDGSENNPYQIEDYADLKKFSSIVNDDSGNGMSAWAVLTKDITATDTEWIEIGDNHNYNYYSGTFNGQGHIISNLNNTEYNNNVVGLFGYIIGGSVKNVGLVNSTIKGIDYVGGIAGYISKCTVENCYNTKGSVEGSNNIGGLIGYSRSSIVQNCYNSCATKGWGTVGGIVGGFTWDDLSATVQNCYNTGAVNGNNTIGGVAGKIFPGWTNNCTLTIQNCYSKSNVNGNDEVGGIVGSNFYCEIKNCFCIDTNDNDIGYNYNGTVENVSKLSADGFKEKNNFSKWEDFDTYWYMNDEAPKLKLPVFVTLHSNFDNDKTSTISIPYDGGRLPSDPFIRDGYVFVKWTENANGTGMSYTNGQTVTLKEETNLYAQWREIVKYHDPNDPLTEKECDNYELIKNETKRLSSGWYVVNGSVNVGERVVVEDRDVNIILRDGAELRVPLGITVTSGKSLTIWAESGGSGSLLIDRTERYCAGIGGYVTKSTLGIINDTQKDCGAVTINGGNITVYGGENAAGIGGGKGGRCDVVTINGGSLTVKGGNGASPFVSEGGSVNIKLGGNNSAPYIKVGTLNGSRVDWAPAGQRTEALRRSGVTVRIETCDHEKYVSKKCYCCGAPDPLAALDGSGSKEDPYQIKSLENWNLVASVVASGSVRTFGIYFKQTADITGVQTMLGTAENPFKGSYDGDGHTLSVSIKSSGANFVAPFSHVEGAVIENLKTAGAVEGNMHCSGLVGAMYGTGNVIRNVMVETEITVKGTHGGGVVGHGGSSTALLEGVAFIGKIKGGTHVGALWGWSDSANVTLKNCFENGSGYNKTGFNPVGLGKTSGRTVNNVYYLNTKKGSPNRDWTNDGKQAYSVSSGNKSISIDFGTPSSEYKSAGIKVYPTGVSHNGMFYAGEGETVSLSLKYTASAGGAVYVFHASSGTLTKDGGGYKLTMAGANADIEVYQLGDVDGDKTACTLRDAIVLARYIAGWKDYDKQIISEAADADGDGSVTAKDAMILARHIAGWKGYEKLPYSP